MILCVRVYVLGISEFFPRTFLPAKRFRRSVKPEGIEQLKEEDWRGIVNPS